MLQQVAIVMTDDGVVRRVRRCLGVESIEILVDRPFGHTTVIRSRDVRFAQVKMLVLSD